MFVFLLVAFSCLTLRCFTDFYPEPFQDTSFYFWQKTCFSSMFGSARTPFCPAMTQWSTPCLYRTSPPPHPLPNEACLPQMTELLWPVSMTLCGYVGDFFFFRLSLLLTLIIFVCNFYFPEQHQRKNSLPSEQVSVTGWQNACLKIQKTLTSAPLPEEMIKMCG